MRKISHKITLAIISSVIIVALMVGGISIFKSVSMIKDSAKKNLLLEAQVVSQQVDINLISIQTNLEDLQKVIVNSIDIKKLTSDSTYIEQYYDEMQATMTSFAEAGKINTDIYLCLNQDFYSGDELNTLLILNPYGDGFIRAVFPITKKDLNEKKEDYAWYHQPIDTGKVFWSNPYEDDVLDINLITCSVPIIVDKEIIGLVAMDVRFTDFEKIVNDIKIYRTGYAAMVNPNYDFLVHPQFSSKDNLNSVNNGEMKRISEELGQSASGIVETKVEGKDTILGYSKLSNGSTLLLFVPTSELFEELNTMLLYIIIAIVIGIVISIVSSYFLGIQISKPIIKLVGLFKQAEQGDLTVQSVVKTSDETKQLSEAFNQMLSNTNILIGDAKTASVTMIDTAAEINQISDYVKNSSQEISNALSELSKGTTEQASVTEDGNKRISDIIASIEVVVTDIKNIENLMSEANHNIEAGKIAVENQQTHMGEIRLVTKNVSSSVLSLSDKSKEIENILVFIKGISEQTNLLALNAAIEAARAGEHGRGFSVVADQIRKMSEETSKSIKKIEDIIKDVQNGVGEAVTEMEKEQEVTKKFDAVLDDSVNAFIGIANAIDVITLKVAVLSDEAVKLGENSTEAENVISYIASFAEETAASTEEIDASTQEQINSVIKLAKSLSELHEIAYVLNGHVEKFIV